MPCVSSKLLITLELVAFMILHLDAYKTSEQTLNLHIV